MFEQMERFKLAITNLSSLACLSLYHEQVYLINGLFSLHYYQLLYDCTVWRTKTKLKRDIFVLGLFYICNVYDCECVYF